jgi:hypothetical protein
LAHAPCKERAAVDSAPSAELVERLRGEGLDDARVLELAPVAE